MTSADDPTARAEAPDAVAALFEQLAPTLDEWERVVRGASPTLPDLDVRDEALRRALAALRREVSTQTFAYLCRRADEAATAAAATRAQAAATRAAAAETRARLRAERAAGAAVGGRAGVLPRRFIDRAFQEWTVHEVATGDVAWARGPRCLLFSSEGAIRRVWRYPPTWRALPDAELEALSWTT